MFTGIITDVGKVRALERRGDLRARIASGYDMGGVDIGASIACSGVCLTVVDKGIDEQGRGWFAVDLSAETVSRTAQGHWNAGCPLNLERALKVGDELGGHLVTGHVDSVGQVVLAEDVGGSRKIAIRISRELAPFVAPKGSITIRHARAVHATEATTHSVSGRPLLINAFASADAFPYAALKSTYTEHFRTLVRGTPARWAHHDPEPCPTPPDFSAGYTSIYAQQAGEPGTPTPRDPGHRLEQQGRFADTGIAAQKNGGAGDQTAAQRPIEFRQAGRLAYWQFAGLVEIDKLHRPATTGQIVLHRKHGGGRILHQRIPLRAIGALPLPAVRDTATSLTDIAFLRFRHGVSLNGTFAERNCLARFIPP